MNSEFIKKRRFRVIISILIASAAIFILTGQKRRINFSGEKVLTVGVFSDSYWGVQSGYANKIIDDAILKFEKEHPDVKVRYESGIMKEDYSEWLSEQMMNDSAPDVFFIPGGDFSTFAQIDALKNLGELISKDPSFDEGAFYKSAYEYGQYGGRQLTLPFECAPNMMFVNKTILDRENIELPDRDWTWDDFYEICRKVTKDKDGTGTINQFGAVNYTWIDAFDANGVVLFDEKGSGCDFTVPEVGDAIAFLEKLETLGSGYALSEKDFAKGNVAFQPMLFSEYRAYKSQELSIKKYSGFEWDCVTMPAGPSGDNYSRLDTLSIAMSENTAQEDMAWEFMKLLTMDPGIQSEIFEYSAGISVLPQVTQSEDTLSRITRNTGEAFNLDILESAMEKAVIRPRFRGYENVKEEVGLAVRSILDSRSNIRMEQIIWNRTINNYFKSLQLNEY